jgi:predicted kinase
MTEVAILIGLQAAGKTMFYRQRLAGTHQHVSKDLMPHNRNKQRRQLQLIAEALDAGDNVAVDNTNPSPEDWRPIIDLARRHGGVAVAYWFSHPMWRRQCAATPAERIRCGSPTSASTRPSNAFDSPASPMDSTGAGR